MLSSTCSVARSIGERDHAGDFEAELFRWDGPAAWVFACVPDEYAPDFAGAFGRVPVLASVDGVTWGTSVWCDKTHGWLLAVPRRVRKGKDDGDLVRVRIELDESRL